MITSKLVGGLGNYLFQIATAYSLSIDNNDTISFNMNDATQIHKNLNEYSNNILKKIEFTNIKSNQNDNYNEPSFTYNEIPYKPNMVLNGYFQSEKYFSHNRDKILELFDISEHKDYLNKKYGNLLNNNTCSIHVRHGDYLNLSDSHPPCSIEYYKNAIKCMGDNTLFLVFSDDINWCKSVFKDDKFYFIENELDYIDLYLMSMCKNNIIANSTFSWWGSWLNKNKEKKIIAPSKWFGKKINHDTKDLIPKEWIVM